MADLQAERAAYLAGEAYDPVTKTTTSSNSMASLGSSSSGMKTSSSSTDSSSAAKTDSSSSGNTDYSSSGYRRLEQGPENMGSDGLSIYYGASAEGFSGAAVACPAWSRWKPSKITLTPRGKRIRRRSAKAFCPRSSGWTTRRVSIYSPRNSRTSMPPTLILWGTL